MCLHRDPCLGLPSLVSSPLGNYARSLPGEERSSWELSLTPLPIGNRLNLQPRTDEARCGTCATLHNLARLCVDYSMIPVLELANLRLECSRYCTPHRPGKSTRPVRTKSHSGRSPRALAIGRFRDHGAHLFAPTHLGRCTGIAPQVTEAVSVFALVGSRWY